jgi:DNA modification methylase
MKSGSVATLIAAGHTGRQVRLIEPDPKYVEMIVRRRQEMTETIHADIQEKSL